MQNFHLLEKTSKLASLLVLVLVTKMIISKVLVMKTLNLNLLVLVLEFQKATSIHLWIKVRYNNPTDNELSKYNSENSKTKKTFRARG